MFLGEFRQTIDDDGRLAIPQHFIAQLAAGFVITRGFERNLAVFTGRSWLLLADKLARRPLSDSGSRALRRRIFSSAANLVPGRNGMIRLPDPLREFAGLQGEVVLTGMYDYLEIWSVEAWRFVRNKVESIEAWELSDI